MRFGSRGRFGGRRTAPDGLDEGTREGTARSTRRLDPGLVIALAGLNLADLATTLVGLRDGYAESAPVAAAALQSNGSAGLLMLGLAGLGLQLVVLATMPRVALRAGWALSLGLAAFPVLHNLVVLLRP